MIRKNKEKRGFALLTVMMIVALIALGAAALLDLVEIDLGVAAEHRKTLAAQSNAVGAVIETIGDDNFTAALPPLDDPDLTTTLVMRDTGSYQRYPTDTNNPAGFPTATTITYGDSPFVGNVGGDSEDGYESEARFLRLVPPTDSSVDLPMAIYEVEVLASVSGGDASSRATALVKRHVNRGVNLRSQRHGR